MKRGRMPRTPRALLLATVACLASTAMAAAQPIPERPPIPPVLSLDQALQWAFQFNPELAAIRQQHGIASAQVIIADTYPFNPVLENRVQASSGPTSAGITNRVPLEHILVWELEVRGQR